MTLKSFMIAVWEPWKESRFSVSVWKEMIADTLPGAAGCTVRDCVNQESDDAHFIDLNTVNGFLSFIKKRYDFYRGVASKYINRYNALFATAYRNAESIIGRLTETVSAVTGTSYYHSNKDVRTARVLVI